MILIPTSFIAAILSPGVMSGVNTFLIEPELMPVVNQGPKLSLSEAIKLAETNSFSMRIANSNIEKANQRSREARGQLGPKIVLDASYTRFDKAQTSDFNGTTISTRPVDSKDAKLTFSMPFDIAGVTGKAVKGANLNIEINRANLETARNDLGLTVKRGYFQVLQAQNQLAVVREGVLRAQERLNNAESEFKAGTRAKVDVLRFETAVRQAENDQLQAENALQIAKNAFNNSLGRDIETPFELEPATFWTPTDQADAELIEVANAQRPELKAVKLQSELQAFLRLVEERGTLPSLNFSVQHSRAFGQTGFGGSSGSTFGVLALSFPIFDSGVTRARVKAARQDEEQVKIQQEQLMLGISLEVRQARASLRNAASRLVVARKSVELAQETFRLQTLRFQNGEGIPLEVADANTELTRAKTNLVSAEFDYLRSVAELERAIGGTLMEGKK
ncbi:MAG: TolC family protein [Fimbriimonadaceae bacterium]